jgi:hypothetical protein
METVRKETTTAIGQQTNIIGHREKLKFSTLRVTGYTYHNY